MRRWYKGFLRHRIPMVASRTIGNVHLTFCRRDVTGHGWIGLKPISPEWGDGPVYGVCVATVLGDIHVEWCQP